MSARETTRQAGKVSQPAKRPNEETVSSRTFGAAAKNLAEEREKGHDISKIDFNEVTALCDDHHLMESTQRVCRTVSNLDTHFVSMPCQAM